MKTKLTLSIDPDIVKRAKDLARARHVSISSLIEDHLNSLTKDTTTEQFKPSTFLKQIPVRRPAPPIDNNSDDNWLEENLEI